MEHSSSPSNFNDINKNNNTQQGSIQGTAGSIGVRSDDSIQHRLLLRPPPAGNNHDGGFHTRFNSRFPPHASSTTANTAAGSFPQQLFPHGAAIHYHQQQSQQVVGFSGLQEPISDSTNLPNTFQPHLHVAFVQPTTATTSGATSSALMGRSTPGIGTISQQPTTLTFLPPPTSANLYSVLGVPTMVSPQGIAMAYPGVIPHGALSVPPPTTMVGQMVRPNFAMGFAYRSYFPPHQATLVRFPPSYHPSHVIGNANGDAMHQEDVYRQLQQQQAQEMAEAMRNAATSSSSMKNKKRRSTRSRRIDIGSPALLSRSSSSALVHGEEMKDGSLGQSNDDQRFGERRLAIVFESYGKIGKHPQTIGSRSIFIPDGLIGRFTKYSEDWMFEIHHGDTVMCKDGVERVLITWLIRNCGSGREITATETAKEALERGRIGRTICNRVFREAVDRRRSEYLEILDEEISRPAQNDCKVSNLQSLIKTLSCKRFAQGPLVFGLYHSVVQENLARYTEQQQQAALSSSSASFRQGEEDVPSSIQNEMNQRYATTGDAKQQQSDTETHDIREARLSERTHDVESKPHVKKKAKVARRHKTSSASKKGESESEAMNDEDMKGE